ncbi:MAG: hypothetical protein L3J06_10670 [Cyclobacteriaceae bacterium]|nr:hypothetical protein [Cyclobacteriaceae bacterium]
MSKLEDLNFLTSIFRSDSMLHLKPIYEITPKLVADDFFEFTKELNYKFKKQFGS